jgi:hypothetical protein
LSLIVIAYTLALFVAYGYNKAVAMTTGNDKMVSVNVKVPREMRDQLNEVAKARKWSLAVTVREAIEQFVKAELTPRPSRKGRGTVAEPTVF